MTNQFYAWFAMNFLLPVVELPDVLPVFNFPPSENWR